MKKLVILSFALLAVLASFQNTNAKTYYRTFEVAAITGEGIVLKDFEGGKLLVNKDPSGFKVGDIVRYDTVRGVLKISPWQPAKVLKMTDRTVTLQLKNNDQVNADMKSHYQGKFKEGDTVQYRASTGQIKKSN